MESRPLLEDTINPQSSGFFKEYDGGELPVSAANCRLAASRTLLSQGLASGPDGNLVWAKYHVLSQSRTQVITTKYIQYYKPTHVSFQANGSLCFYTANAQYQIYAFSLWNAANLLQTTRIRTTCCKNVDDRAIPLFLQRVYCRSNPINPRILHSPTSELPSRYDYPPCPSLTGPCIQSILAS